MPYSRSALPVSCIIALLLLIDLQAFGQWEHLVINEVMAVNVSSMHDRKREYDDWIEFYNSGTESANLGGCFLSDDREKLTKYRFTDTLMYITIMGGGSQRTFWLDKQPAQGPDHLGLKLSAKGETLYLTAPDSVTIIDSMQFGQQLPDRSFGRIGDGSTQLGYLEKPTPRNPNSTTGFLGISTPVVFSKTGGFCTDAFRVTITGKKGEQIYYTTDGTAPTAQSPKYTNGITVAKSAVVRAVAIGPNMLPSAVVSQSYLFEKPGTMATVSIGTNHYDMFQSTDAKLNIYKEVPVSVEFYEPDGTQGFDVNAGMRLVGKAIRNYPQKSISLHLRSSYGASKVKYDLFPDKEPGTWHTMLLRNSGNDWSKTLMRDALMHRLVSEGTAIDFQGYRPTRVFINGDYWGIHNLREKICRHYIASNHPEVDDGSIDMIEFMTGALRGNTKSYDALVKFVADNDMKDDSLFAEAASQVDLDNFIDYQLAEIFYANTDWPMANMKYWKPRVNNGKWRWILFDTDLAFELDKRRCPGHHNSIAYALGVNNCHLDIFDSGLTESTTLLRGFVANDAFRTRFLLRFADLLNSNFSTPNVVATIEGIKAELQPEMERHVNRWKPKGIGNLKRWDQNIGVLLQFARERPDTLRGFFQEQFKLSAPVPLRVEIEGAEGGTVQVNSLAISAASWDGLYFPEMAVPVTAIPKEGWKFAGWSGAAKGKKATSIDLSKGPAVLIARFKKK